MIALSATEPEPESLPGLHESGQGTSARDTVRESSALEVPLPHAVRPPRRLESREVPGRDETGNESSSLPTFASEHAAAHWYQELEVFVVCAESASNQRFT